MKKMFIILIVSIFIIGVVWGESEISVSADDFNFGYAPQNAKVTCAFWIYAGARDTLKISRVKTSCGCTKAPLDKNVLNPGDSTYLEIVFSTRQYRGESSRSIQISSNATPPTKELKIKANVQTQMDLTEPIVINPYKVDISKFGEKMRDKSKFSIENKSDNDIELTMVYYPEEYFDIDLPKVVKAGKTAEGKVQIKNEYQSEEFNKSFTFELNDDNHSRFTVPVTRVIRQLGSTQASK